jgi:hypothetical protein
MSTETEERRDSREAGGRYGLRMADEFLPLIVNAEDEETIMRHIKEMAQQIEQHAQEFAEHGLGYELAGVWMRAAGEAALARLQALMDQAQRSTH